MKILIVGGTGPIGASIALHLEGNGHKVVVSSRHRPPKNSPLSKMPWIQGNYLDESYSATDLKTYDGIVFAAGSDVRHIPEGEDADTHFLHANAVMVPRFAKLAKDAGVEVFIHIGSFYPHVMPEIIETNPYVRSRYLASENVTALSSETFRAISIDAPFVIGMPKGMKSDMFMAYLAYGKGLHPNVAPFGPAGGTNFISTRSLAQAVAGALERGQGGRSYLVGDENVSFSELFGFFFKAVGNKVAVPSKDEEHPFLPDSAIIQGRGNFIDYEPDADDVQVLGYERNDIFPTIQTMARDVEELIGEIKPLYIGAEALFNSETFALACKYAQAVDAGDVELLKSISTDDIVIVGPGFINEGIEEVSTIPLLLRTFFSKTRHVVNQQLVVTDGDKAYGQTFCSAKHILNPADSSSPRELLKWDVRYQDYFQRADKTWRFSRRELIVDWIELGPVHLPETAVQPILQQDNLGGVK